mmetsp:Transcript_89530/g.242839  ORF Transcript_89530/g.242839 Transcript_89530/m.242839 type:complete len:204 (+) Transcript_89530:200-811(+)
MTRFGAALEAPLPCRRALESVEAMPVEPVGLRDEEVSLPGKTPLKVTLSGMSSGSSVDSLRLELEDAGDAESAEGPAGTSNLSARKTGFFCLETSGSAVPRVFPASVSCFSGLWNMLPVVRRKDILPIACDATPERLTRHSTPALSGRSSILFAAAAWPGGRLGDDPTGGSRPPSASPAAGTPRRRLRRVLATPGGMPRGTLA